MAALVAQGKQVSVPWGDNAAYDLVLDDDGTLLRVQCKTGRLRNNRVVFQTSSVYLVEGKYTKFDYRGKIDLWAVCCFEISKIYLIPIADMQNTSQAVLHLEAPRFRNRHGYKLADKYELGEGG